MVSKLATGACKMKTYELSFICEELNIDQNTIITWIESQLVIPIKVDELTFDEEDFSRIRLLHEIQETYSSNLESLEVILHLIDQIHLLNHELKKKKD